MKKSIWIKHFFCLLAFLIVGTFPAISIGNHYDFKLIGSQNGMPSIISCIYTEQKGFIWIGTPTGLIRFDGTELKKYTAQPDNENSLPNDSILQIIEDNQQTTWILTTTGIARYSLIHDNFFIPKLNNQPIIAKSICKIADGLLFGGINKIYKYSYATNTISLIREFKTDEPFIIPNVETRYHILSKLATGNTANEPQEFRDNPISFPIRERQRRNHHRLPTKNMAVNLQQWRQVFLRPGKIDSQLYHSKLPFEQ